MLRGGKITAYSLLHDGHTLQFTLESLKSKNDLIGFYFDDLELPQMILRKSLYGAHILKQLNEVSRLTAEEFI